jgi:hypothetical protein
MHKIFTWGSMKAISTIAAIRALSDDGAALFDRQLGWLNPLPQSLDDVFERIRFAIDRAEYIADRTGKEISDAPDLVALRYELEQAAKLLSTQKPSA